ncbi:light-regulated protein, chloroplastic [Euphorbia lathyris]|uniref:light-regulated protein, chloroplastic n=1 Tax=Euphorbia lathyris TaxID=212925 RepID=UPI003313DE5D
MQAAIHLPLPPLSTVITSSKSMAMPRTSFTRLQTSRCSIFKAKQDDIDEVDYSSMVSVFPAEACETIGGEACEVEMYPEAKLKPEAKNTKTNTATEQIDRDYLEYSNPKTVFIEEACDDLGGEFCEPEFLQP